MFVTDPGSVQRETNKNNNVKAVPINLKTPNLTVEQFSANETASPNQSIPVSWTVNNTGAGDAFSNSNNRWRDVIYLSDNAVFDTSDIQVKEKYYEDSLLSQDNYTVDTELVLPANKVGERYLIFVTDRENQATETNESDNVRAIPLNIQAANLEVTSATTPNAVAWGQTIPVNWTVNNTGLGEAIPIPNNNWQDRVYLSRDNTLDGNDSVLASRNRTSALSPGSNYVQQADITIPNNVTGDYYLIYVADDNQKLTETNNEDNTYAVPISIGTTDLAVTAVNAPNSIIWNEEFSLDWDVTNQSGVTSQGWSSKVYLSQDGVKDSDDLVLGSFNNKTSKSLVQNETDNTAGQFIINTLDLENTTDWYILVEIKGNLIDSDNSNNVFAQPIKLLPPQHGDLVVNTVTTSATANSGSEIEVNWQVSNQGNSFTDVNSWQDRLILSKDSVLDEQDTELKVITHTGVLASGNSYSNTTTVKLPEEISGEYYIFATSDSGGRVFEFLSEDNNTARSVNPIAINLKPVPDLQVSSINNDLSGQPGTKINVDWTISNQGTAAALGNRVDRVYLSSDGTLDNAIQIQEIVRPQELAVGSEQEVSAEIVLPNNIADGDYQLIVVTDATEQIFERGEENNNQLIAEETIQIRHADITSSLNIPTSITSGTSLPLNWMVENKGTGKTLTSWTDKVYLSEDETFNPSQDELIGEYRHNESIASGETKQVEVASYQIPVGSSGNKYIFVVNDANKEIQELEGENNNVVANPIEIELAPYADLAVSNVTAPNLTIDDPAKVKVSWTVTNQGTGTGYSDTWVDRVIVSKDETVGNGDDLVIGEYTHTGFLAESESYNRSENILLPPARVSARKMKP